MKAHWQPAKFLGLPQYLADKLGGSASWQNRIAIVLPHQGRVSYDIDVDADLIKVSSHLPSPLGKPAGEALPLRVKVSGGLNGFTLTGSTGKQSHFNSEWLFAKKQLTLARAAWQNAGTDQQVADPQPTATRRRAMAGVISASAETGWRLGRLQFPKHCGA
nr:hypothetical protein [Serratia symbiotica]